MRRKWTWIGNLTAASQNRISDELFTEYDQELVEVHSGEGDKQDDSAGRSRGMTPNHLQPMPLQIYSLRERQGMAE